MSTAKVNFGIPDIDLPRIGGGTVNPASFAGHPLIVLFCPADAAAADLELEAYSRYARDLCRDDAWFIAIRDKGSDKGADAKDSRFPVAIDRDQSAWSSFQDLLEGRDRQQRGQGSVFLFGRGGGLQRSWKGPGHARDVVHELKQRA